jgi:putative acetyltransferase
MVLLRKYKPADAPKLWKLKHETIHSVNSRDYSEEQVNAWSSKGDVPAPWQERADGLNPFVAEINGIIVGYADVQADGYVDHFFCHKDYQGMGVGKALMTRLIEEAEKSNLSLMYSHVSLTARPFFEHFGFKVVKAQKVDINGVILNNFRMEKILH